MSTLRPPPDPESDPRVRAVFDDIRRTRRTDLVNNLWRTLAFDPAREVFTAAGGLDEEANGLRSRPARDPWA